MAFDQVPNITSRFHHVGFVVNNIAEMAVGFTRSVNGAWNGAVFEDPIQKVKVTFLSTPGSTVQIELVEPVGPDSPVRAFLEKGGGLHHLCYEVKDCEEALSVIRQNGGKIVRRSKPAIAFGGRNIAWALTEQKLLIEFLDEALK